MNTFEGILASIAKDLDYTPRLLPKTASSVRISNSDVALIYPTSIVDIEGCERVRLSSKIEFTLLKNASAAPYPERVKIWNKAKQDAIEIISSLKKYRSVVSVYDITIEPLTKVITHFDEVALSVTFYIISNYTSVAPVC